MLEVVDVNQYYGESHTLWDVRLQVPAGGCTCLMGRNGVGKSTLLKTVMGLLPARSGRIRWGEDDLAGRRAEARARAGIGYVPQGREIFPQLTVEENLRVALPRRVRGGASEVWERTFSLFPVLQKMLRRRGGDLSGGQQQQLAIARALVMKPRLIVLDEPTEGIQPSIIKDIGRVIALLRARGDMAILLVEQYFDFAQELAQAMVVMDRGDIVLAGRREDLDEADVRRRLSV